MDFAVTKLFWWFANPGNMLLGLLCLGVLALVARWRRLGGLLVGLVAVMGLAITLLPVRVWVLQPLENRFPLIAKPLPKVDGVIVLGGAINTWLSAQRGQPQLTESAERLIAFADMARQYPAAKLVFAGGSAALFDDAVREADIARQVLGQMGVDTGRVKFERESRNTDENAAFAKRMINPQPGEVWLLITSAYHMPRAVGVFRKVGWDVTAYPVDYSVPPTGGEPPFNLLDGLAGVNWGIREWIGLFYYHLTGRIDSWFPGPT